MKYRLKEPSFKELQLLKNLEIAYKKDLNKLQKLSPMKWENLLLILKLR